jgi:hypothetical protein
MSRLAVATQEELACGREFRRGDPGRDRLAGLLGQCEPDWLAGLSLLDRGSRQGAIFVSDVTHPESDQIATAQLAVDGDVEQREVPRSLCNLKADSDCADLSELEGWLLSRDLPLFQGGRLLALSATFGSVNIALSSTQLRRGQFGAWASRDGPRPISDARVALKPWRAPYSFDQKLSYL